MSILINKINSLKKDFTLAEQKISAYILKNSQTTLTMNLKALAVAIPVGEATILRFYRKLGFASFIDFKLSLSNTLNTKSTKHPNIKLLKNKSNNQLAQHLYNNSLETLYNTIQNLNPSSIANSINLIHKAPYIEFIGVGYSNLTALEAKDKFLRIGKKVTAHTNYHNFIMSTAIAKRQDLIIAISQRGETYEVIEALKNAQKRGAKTIIITTNSSVKLTQYANEVLLSGYTNHILETGSFSERISQLFIIELLYLGLLLKDKNKREELKKLTVAAITSTSGF